MIPQRFAYSRMPAYPGLEPGLPMIPFTLTYQGQSCTIQAVVDSGSSINVLPYDIGLQLGLIWEMQAFALPVAHWLRGVATFGVLLTGQLDPFPPVELAFAWMQKTSAEIPVILGETNFFQEFDVWFSGSQQIFEIAPKGTLIKPTRGKREPLANEPKH
jgi:hypothetical protein